MREGSYRIEPTSLPVSDLFRCRFFLIMSERSTAITKFVNRINEYGGEFVSEGESLKIRYNDVIVVIKNGVLVNVFKQLSKGK